MRATMAYAENMGLHALSLRLLMAYNEARD
jgi:hypothetical protein